MNPQVMRLIQSLLRGKGRSKWSLVVVGIIVAYMLLQPVLGPIAKERFGLTLPSFETTVSAPPQDREFRQNTRPVLVATTDGEQAILDAFQKRKSDVIVQTTATVKKNLPDDNIGSRHQKAILLLPSGHTVLLAHNIDLADKVPFNEGDTIEVCGEYEYTDQGGVIHWTHHDPRGRHEDGWIQHQGIQYK